MFFKAGDLKNSAIFTGKHSCLESPFNKVALNFVTKKDIQHRYFPLNIAKFLKTAFVVEDQWLPLV